MTEDNRTRNVADEVSRARQALAAAKALLDLDLAADSISRAYYAAYHFLRALLFSMGLEPRSHKGALHLFNVHFVRPGLLPTSHNRLLAGLQRSRDLADYDAAATFSREDARGQIQDAEALATDATAFLQREGWLSESS